MTSTAVGRSGQLRERGDRSLGSLALVALVMVVACGDGGVLGGIRNVRLGGGCTTADPEPVDAGTVELVDEPEPSGGSVAWSQVAPNGNAIEALAAAGEVSFVGAGLTVSALTLEDGEERWLQEVATGELVPDAVPSEGGATVTDLAADDQVVAAAIVERTSVGDPNDPGLRLQTVVAALDAATGAQRWVSPILPGEVRGLEVVDDVVVIELSSSKRLARMSSHSTCQAESPAGAPTAHSPASATQQSSLFGTASVYTP